MGRTVRHRGRWVIAWFAADLGIGTGALLVAAGLADRFQGVPAAGWRALSAAIAAERHDSDEVWTEMVRVASRGVG